VRLTLLLAPVFCILGAIGTVELGKPAVDIVREAVIYPKRKTRVISRIGREFGVAIFLILLIAIIPTFWTAVRGSYQPATIVTSSIPTAPAAGSELKYQDWLEALSWMRLNTPPSSVVFAWWDYGYWITALGDRSTIADNGTQNSTQIGMIAQTFLDNITFALPNLQRYNVSYVAIFITPSGGTSGGWQGFGEDGKWYWMARIGNNTMWNNKYEVTFLETSTNPQTGASDYARIVTDPKTKAIISNDTITTSAQLNTNSMLGYMMTVTTSNTQTTPSPYLTQVFSSSNKFVYLFKVNLIKSSFITMRPVRTPITYGTPVVMSGNLTDTSGNPLASQPAQVVLESSVDSGQSWQQIGTVNAAPNGAYNYTAVPNAGTFLIRAHYYGTGTYSEVTSTPEPLLVTKSNATLTISTSPATFNVGQNITVAVTLSPYSPYVTGTNVTISYTFDNKTFTPINTIVMTAQTMSFTWKADVPGTFMLVATLQAGVNYNPATAYLTIRRS